MRKLCAFIAVTMAVFGDVYFVSDRLDFVDSDQVSSSTRIKEIPEVLLCTSSLFAPDRMEQWKDQLVGKKIAVLIHGYNNEHNDAVELYSNILKRSSELYDVFICYFWPGGNHRHEYFEARERASRILPDRLSVVIRDLIKNGESVDILAHSMGCRLALETLEENSDLFVRNVFLMAPAVDNEAIEKGEVYFEGASRCKSLYVFHSEADTVLGWGYLLGEGDRALGYTGSENPYNLSSHVSFIDMSEFRIGHGDYANSLFVFDKIKELLHRKEE